MAMIRLARLKRIIAVVATIAAALVAAGVIRELGDTVLRSASGADPAAVFNDIPPAPGELAETLRWLPDTPRDGREMEPTTRRQLTDAYARALAALDRAGRGDADAPLADYLSGPALEMALTVTTDATHLASTTTHRRHDLRLDFYSDDGSVVGLTAPAVELERRTHDPASGGEIVLTTTESWQIVLLLEDGNWRVQQLRADSVALQPTAPDFIET